MIKISDNICELYAVFLFTSEKKNEFEIFYDKPSLLRYVRGKLGFTEWKDIILPQLVRQIDTGEVISVSYLSNNRRMFYKKITTRVGIEKLKASILEGFIEDYFKNDVAKV